MADIISIKTRSGKPATLRRIRAEYGLTLTQAAIALEASPAVIERWEVCPELGPSEEFVRGRMEGYLLRGNGNKDNNVLFGAYPLRLARLILGLTVDQMAHKWGYTPAAWQKVEANVRKLDEERLRRIEHQVRSHFASRCGLE